MIFLALAASFPALSCPGPQPSIVVGSVPTQSSQLVGRYQMGLLCVAMAGCDVDTHCQGAGLRLSARFIPCFLPFTRSIVSMERGLLEEGGD